MHYRCSITYGRSNKLEMAITHAEEAVARTNRNMRFTYSISRRRSWCACQKMVENRKDVTKSELYQAVSHLKSAVAMDPLYAQAYVWLALVYSELDEHARAISAKRGHFIVPAGEWASAYYGGTQTALEIIYAGYSIGLKVRTCRMANNGQLRSSVPAAVWVKSSEACFGR